MLEKEYPMYPASGKERTTRIAALFAARQKQTYLALLYLLTSFPLGVVLLCAADQRPGPGREYADYLDWRPNPGSADSLLVAAGVLRARPGDALARYGDSAALA